MSVKRVFVEPAWKLPLYTYELNENPPKGYTFVIPVRSGRPIFSNSYSQLLYDLQAGFSRITPLQLGISMIRSLSSRSVDLTWSLTHVRFHDSPWILDMATEQPHLLISPYAKIKGYRTLIRRYLLKKSCRKIICWCKIGKDAILSAYGQDLEDKVVAMYWGVSKKDYTKSAISQKINILFINSGNMNNEQHFVDKGGLELLKAIKILMNNYKNFSIMIRSGLDIGLKNAFSKFQNIRIIDAMLSREELDAIWRAGDLFVMPNRYNTPAKVFLEAMSYGLPIITTDIWANPELVRHGETGLLVRHPYTSTYNKCLSPNMTNKPNESIVKGLVEAISYLLEDESLRVKMGKKARSLVDNGPFSIESRNERLSRVLDQSV